MAISEEAYMFAERYAHFANVHTIYRDLISGHYQPSFRKHELRPASPVGRLPNAGRADHGIFVLYAYFYSIRGERHRRGQARCRRCANHY
jgi:hypothetical protein